MRDLINIGKLEPLYIDANEVMAILPDEKKTFGSIVIVMGLSHPVATSLEPGDVIARLRGNSIHTPSSLTFPEINK